MIDKSRKGLTLFNACEDEVFYDYIIYTDGAYSQKNDEGAFAYVILDEKENIIKWGAWKIEHETNNRAELKAIIAAIHHLPDDAHRVKVISDSQYALYTLSGKWSRNANTDLFDAFDNVVLRRRADIEITYEWVKGHNGNRFNEMCDAMCNDKLGYDANAEFEKYKLYKQQKRQWSQKR